MKTLAFVVAVGLAGIATDAQAAHCKALSKAFSDIKKIGAQVDKAEARDDMDAACELQKKRVALLRRTLANTEEGCFHGGRKMFETSLLASQGLEEMYCTWDEDDFDEDDF